MRKLLALSEEERWLLLQAASTLLFTKVALWLMPFQHLLIQVERIDDANRKQERRTTGERISWAVQVASRYIPGTRSCLPRALAATMLLRRAGLPAQFRLGVRRIDGRAEGHAWVESEGRVVMGEEELERYVVISGLKGVTR